MSAWTHLHVVPRNDQIAHEDDPNCICGPDVHLETTGEIDVHHALDGRR